MCKQRVAPCLQFVRRDGPHQHAELMGEGVPRNPWGRNPIVRVLPPHRGAFRSFVS